MGVVLSIGYVFCAKGASVVIKCIGVWCVMRMGNNVKGNNDMEIGDDARLSVIPSSVMGETVVATQGESEWALSAVAVGLDLAGGTYVGT